MGVGSLESEYKDEKFDESFIFIVLLQCLDENKKLIMAILENQNLGKLAECAQ